MFASETELMWLWWKGSFQEFFEGWPRIEHCGSLSGESPKGLGATALKLCPQKFACWCGGLGADMRPWTTVYWGARGEEGFVGGERDFKGDVGLDREPVKVDEGGGDVLPVLGVGQNPRSWVLYILEPAGQDSIAINNNLKYDHEINQNNLI